MTATSNGANSRAEPHPLDVGVRRYFGVRALSIRAGVNPDHVYKARTTNSRLLWVPAPDIQVGRRVGWSLPCIEHWCAHSFEPFERAPTIRFASTREMEKHHRMRRETIWQEIRDGRIPHPAVWVDETPGWILPDGQVNQ
ncbi:hypothetical protein [Nocardia wallacei]|uniref:hypothetical protein n=1 Tax=Nocardia wallacei TaxID=480035 RepID=UPI0024568280|nr:hypothetical protein [Nocardia wallacei]